jgi:hypothetical protein
MPDELDEILKEVPELDLKNPACMRGPIPDFAPDMDPDEYSDLIYETRTKPLLDRVLAAKAKIRDKAATAT